MVYSIGEERIRVLAYRPELNRPMALWRAAAIERLPELRSTIQSADSVMALWTELIVLFKMAYRSPVNRSLIRRIYDYGRWCHRAPRGPDAAHDPLTAVHVCFFESIPKDPAARREMPYWFTYEEVASSKHVFGYLLDDDEFEALVAHMKANRHLYGSKPGMVDETGG